MQGIESTNVLIVFSERIPSVQLVCGLISKLKDKYAFRCLERRTAEVREQDISQTDVVLAIRPYEAGMYDIIRAARKAGRKIIVFLDDDLLNLPELSYPSRLRKFMTRMVIKKNADSLKKSLAECDVLWGCNEKLLKQNRKYLKQGRYERTDVTADVSAMKQVLSSEMTGEETFHLLYAGGSDHAGFINQYIIPALNRLFDEGLRFKMTFMGIVWKQLAQCNFETTFIPWMENIDAYRELVMQTQYDAGIAVLPGGDFYRCKYFNKFIEYSIIGVGGIYTDDEPYRSVVKHRDTGLLAENSVDGWGKQLRYAMEHPDACRQYAINAQAYCRERFSAENLVEDLAQKIPELYQFHCLKKKKVRYKFYPYRYVVRDAAIYALGKYENLMNSRKGNVS